MGDWFRVDIPIQGTLTAYVEAESKEHAASIAVDGFQEDDLEWTVMDYDADPDRAVSVAEATQEELDEAMEEPDEYVEDDPESEEEEEG